MTSVCLTGASGFVGQAILSELLLRDIPVTVAVRSIESTVKQGTEKFKIYEVGDIGATTDWTEALSHCDCIIHCAARAHVMHETESDALAAYRTINVKGTRNLADQAAAYGVKRLIYLSSIKVNGEHTGLGEAFQADDHPNPEDAYGISKMEAEMSLYEVSRNTNLDVVCIRPPLVYGPGVKGNFLTLLRWLERGFPLPFGAVSNQRSLVALGNLVDLIITCIDHPAAANQSFLVSDDNDLSTTELLRLLGVFLDKPAHLIPVPAKLLKLGAGLVGKQMLAQRLLGNLQVDISKTKESLSWIPPVSVEEGLKKTTQWYCGTR